MSEHAHANALATGKKRGKSHVPEHALKKTPGSL